MSMSITKAEFMERYGDVLVSFSSYYKYTFYFRGIAENGETITCSIGSSSDDIYKLDVQAGEKKTIRLLDAQDGDITYGCARRGEDEICSFFDY